MKVMFGNAPGTVFPGAWLKLDQAPEQSREELSSCDLLKNAAEFITDDGKRFAWSESNVQYEEVPEDGESFTILRTRLSRLEDARDGLVEDLERELEYPHWSEAEKRVLQKSLKWLKERFRL